MRDVTIQKPGFKTVHQEQIDQAQRILISCYEIENGVNLYGSCPNYDRTEYFIKAAKRAFSWIRENKREYLFEAMKFICGGEIK